MIRKRDFPSGSQLHPDTPPYPGRSLLLAAVLVLAIASILPAQVHPGSRYISFSFGSVEDDFSIMARISGQFRDDMGIEVLMGFVPSKGDSSDIYSIVHYRYHLWSDQRIVPHLVGGAGGVIAVGGGKRDADFALSAGGGVTAYITENVGCRFDAENFTVYNESATENRQSYTAGIVLIF